MMIELPRKTTITLLATGVMAVFLAACSQSDPPDPADEEPDTQATELLQQSLMTSMNQIAEQQTGVTDQSNVRDLEDISESDRQDLIDETLEESDELTEKDLDELAELLEEIKGIEHAPIELPDRQTD